MEKLEIKHLAPYLPYGLNVRAEDIINGFEEDDGALLLGLDKKEALILTDGTKSLLNFEFIKPILRPLTDLTKEIEVNGEKFIPRDRLIKILFEKEPESFSSIDTCRQWISNHIEVMVINKGYDNLLHWIYQDLIKWHFDLFGLIPEELAIDINTL